MSIRIGTTADGQPFDEDSSQDLPLYELPDEILTHTMAILAKKGAGKTYAAGVIEEEFARLGLPFVVLDPVGVHHGIRSSADGKAEGFPIVVFGGQHADVPIDRRLGAEVAHAVIDENISCIVDLTELSKTAWREFVRDFCLTLYKFNRSPRHVIIEEATEFVPQTRRPELQEAYEAVERLVRLGRNRGLGCTLISQRSAQVAKDVLTQIDILIALRTVGIQDRNALLAMFETVLEEDQLADLERFKKTITKLPNGTAWLWWPDHEQFVQVQIRKRHTYHAGATPTFKAAKVVQAKPDVSALRERFAQVRAAEQKPVRGKAQAGPDPRVLELERAVELARSEHAALLNQFNAEQGRREAAEKALSVAQGKAAAVEHLRTGFTLLGLGGASDGGDGLTAEQVQSIISSTVASLPRGGEPVYVPAPEAIRKGYQRKTVDRIMTRIDALEQDQREALVFMLGQDVFVSINRIAVAISGNDSGGTRQRWTKAVQGLLGLGVVVKGGSGRSENKPRIREWVSSELAPHSPSEQEVDEVYQAVLGRIARTSLESARA